MSFWANLFKSDPAPTSAKTAADRLKVIIATENRLGRRLSQDTINRMKSEIMEVVKEYEDGKLDILSMGRRPFNILEVFEENAYAETDVEYLEDELFNEKPPTASLLKLYERCHELAFGSTPDAPDADRLESFSYQIASELPLDLAYKQTLLEMRHEGERRQSLEAALNKWLVELAETARSRRIARGNGRRHV